MIVTFDDPDFDPGFTTQLQADQVHTLEIAVFSDNADTATGKLIAKRPRADGPLALELTS